MTRAERRWTLGLIAVGVALRLIEFQAGRGFWLDESMLLRNIRERPLPSLLVEHLADAQLAPAGFLAIERWCYELFGVSRHGLRIWPLLGSVAALALMPAVARRRIGPRAALLALALMAFSGDMIYYASELKPYSTDVTATMLGLLTVGWLDARRLGARVLMLAGAVGSALVWFSFPVMLVLGAGGLWRLARAVGSRRKRHAIGIGLVLLAWGASVLTMMAVARGQIGGERVLWRFWEIAFVPRPIFSMDALEWLGGRLAFLFANPLDTWTPLGYGASIVVPIVLAVLGVFTLARRRPAAALDLIGPIAAALAAAASRRYPFHGRLLLFLVPCLLMLIAAGASRARKMLPRGRARAWFGVFLVASLLLFPAIEDLGHAIEPGRVRMHHPLGDLRPISLMPNRFP